MSDNQQEMFQLTVREFREQLDHVEEYMARVEVLLKQILERINVIVGKPMR